MEKEIIIENDLSEIIRITRFIESLGVSLFLSAHTIRRISLAAEEAASSIIHHAYSKGEKGIIKLKTSLVNGDFNCMFINDGRPFDPTLPLKEPTTASPEELLTGGLGFYLIFRTMDEVAYHSDGNHNYLMLTKRIKDVEEPESTLYTNICKVADKFILTIDGRLDTANARKFESETVSLRENGSVDIIINCEKLTYISSSGLRSFILLQKKICSQNRNLVIINMLPEIYKIFDMTGCSSLFTFR